MTIQAGHELHSSPLQLFEQNFSPLINQSKNIIIHYCLGKAKAKAIHCDRINIISVNGCSTPEEFRKCLTEIIEPSLENLYQWLKCIHHLYWDPHLEYIRSKLQKLTMIVEDERFLFQNEEFVQIREHHFKSFTNCKLLGPKDGDLLLFSQCIRFKAVRFAEVWVEVLYEAIDRLILIHKLLLQSFAIETESKPQPIAPKPNNSFNIKSNLTVPQLAYLFRILAKTNIIEIPARRNNELINWIIGNFQSKNRETIKHTSLRIKYFTPDPAAIDFWELKLHDFLKMISTDRDSILE